MAASKPPRGHVVAGAFGEGDGRGERVAVDGGDFEDELLQTFCRSLVGDLVDAFREIHHLGEQGDRGAVERFHLDAVGHGEHVRSFCRREQ